MKTEITTVVKKSINIFKIILFLIGLILFVEIYEWVITLKIIKEWFSVIFISLSNSDYRSFLNATWQVQTSIAILTITFITLILGKLEIKIFGFKLNELISLNNSKFKMNYWEKVWLNIITVAINFFYVAQANLTAVSIVFLISIILTILLLKESLDIIMKPETYEEKLKGYVLQKLNEEIKNENKMDHHKRESEGSAD